MRINVSGARPEHTINGLEINPDEGVDGLRQAVAGRLQAAPEQLRLIHMGRLIDGSRPLTSFLQDESTIHVVVTPPPSQNSNNSTTTNNNNNNNTNTSGTNTGRSNPTFAEETFGTFINIASDPSGPSAELLQRVLAPTIITALQSIIPTPPTRNDSTTEGVRIFTSFGTQPQQQPPPPRPPQSQEEQTQQQSGAAPQQQNQQQQQSPRSMPFPIPMHMPIPVPPIPQTRNTHLFPLAPPVPQAEISPSPALHIHVHVSPNELENLPEQLERLRNRMHIPGWSNIRTHIERETNLRNNNFSTFTNSTSEGTSNNNGGGSINTNNLRNRRSTREEEEEEQEGSSNENELSRFLQFITSVFTYISNISQGSMAALIQGDWNVVARARTSIMAAARRFLESELNTSNLSTDEIQQNCVERCVNCIINAIRNRSELMQAIESQIRPQINFFSDLKRILTIALKEIIDAVFSPNALNTDWANGIRVSLVRAVGIIMQRSSTWFVSGPLGIMTISAKIFELLSRSPLIQQSTALMGFLPFMPLAVNSINLWHSEYMTSHRQESDANIFDNVESNTNEEEGDEEEDNDLLDDCLAEFCADETPRAATTSTDDSDELREALNALGGVTETVCEEICRRAQRFRYEEPENNNSNNEATVESSKMWESLKKK